MSGLTIDVLEHESTGVWELIHFMCPLYEMLLIAPLRRLSFYDNTWDYIPKPASNSKSKSKSNVVQVETTTTFVSILAQSDENQQSHVHHRDHQPD
jgi:hypothetical protein